MFFWWSLQKSNFPGLLVGRPLRACSCAGAASSEDGQAGSLNTFRLPCACPRAASSTSSALQDKSNDDCGCELNTPLGSRVTLRCPAPSRPPTKGPASARRARSAVLMNGLCRPTAHRAFTSDRPLGRTQSIKERCSLRWPFAALDARLWRCAHEPFPLCDAKRVSRP